MLAIRARRPAFRSRPSRQLFLATLVVRPALPFTPLAGSLGFQPLPAYLLLPLWCIVAVYVVTVEVAERVFYGVVRS